MREIHVSQITDVIEKLCIDANYNLPGDVKCAIKNCRACEDGALAKDMLDNGGAIITELHSQTRQKCVPS
jgi:fumarate hydratase subunit alpha